MMLSIAVPIIFMWSTKITPAQIGFTEMEKGSIKTVSYFVPVIAAKIGFLFNEINHDIRTHYRISISHNRNWIVRRTLL